VGPHFRTAARAYGQRMVGVVLTGNISCGTEGLMAIRAQGGVAVVQNDPECSGMSTSPGTHAELDRADLAPLDNPPVAP
jgi:two-component system chemotaxis response regulator CheB